MQSVPLRSAIPLAACLLVSSSATAQSAILREGDASPDGVFGQAIAGLSFPQVGRGSGYGVFVRDDGLAGLHYQIWGSLGGTAGTVLHSQGTYGPATQVNLDREFGLGYSEVVYGASIMLSGSTGTLDSIWVDGNAVTVEGQPVAGVPGRQFKDMRTPGATSSGQPFFYGTMTDMPGGATLDAGIFLGNAPLLRQGQSLSNVAQHVNYVGFDFDVSSNGSHFIVETSLDTYPSSEDLAVVLDGAVLELGGSFVRETVPIAPSVGGIGDAWRLFRDFEVNAAGDFAFSGRTDGDSSTDGFIARSGDVFIREGDVIDGLTLDRDPDEISLSEDNQLAFLWDAVDANGHSEAGLFVDNRLIIKTGDAVDWDGDGVIDPGATIRAFSSSGALAMGQGGTLYFTALVEIGGANLDGYFVMETSGLVSANYCQANANTSGLPASITALGSSKVADNDLSLLCSDMPSNAFGFFLNSQTQGFIANPAGSAGNLCLSGTIGRFQQQIQNSGTQGAFLIPVDLSALPQPIGTTAVTAGQTWNFSAWFRDSNGMGGATSNFSDGIEISFY